MSDEGTTTKADHEAVPAWAVALVEDSAATRKVVTDLSETVLAFDSRLKVVEGREVQPIEIPRYSGRVSALEQNDESVNKRLERLESKTDAQSVVLDRILGNPTVKKVAQSVAGCIIAVSALLTFAAYQKLTSMQSKVEERPAQPSVTVVPVFMPNVDAGGPDARQ